MRSIMEVPRALERTAPKPAGSAAHPPDVPTCLRCRDAGYVRFNVPITDPNFGRLIPCECRLREQERRRHEELLRLGNLAPSRT